MFWTCTVYRRLAPLLWKGCIFWVLEFTRFYVFFYLFKISVLGGSMFLPNFTVMFHVVFVLQCRQCLDMVEGQKQKAAR